MNQANQKNKIILALGSNLGDRAKFLEEAIFELEKKLLLKNIKQSRIIENKAMLLPNSPKDWDIDFLNIVISGEIELSKFNPGQILQTIKKIEKNLGRKDRGKWSPREIDIDILAIDDLQININDKLVIPHQGLFERDFFIDGFKEIELELFLKLRYFITCKSRDQ